VCVCVGMAQVLHWLYCEPSDQSLICGRSKDFSCSYGVQACSCYHPASYGVGTDGTFPGLCWPLTLSTSEVEYTFAPSVVLIKNWRNFGSLFMFKALDYVSCFVSRDFENWVHLFTLSERGYDFTHWLIELGSRVGNGRGEKSHCHCQHSNPGHPWHSKLLDWFRTVIRVPVYVSIYLWSI
jgi:hypothetical protein